MPLRAAINTGSYEAVSQCHCEGLPRRREDRSNLIRDGNQRDCLACVPKRHFGVQARSILGVYPEVFDPSTQLRVDAEQHRGIEGLAMTKRGLGRGLGPGG
jgi:hypothetical protein